MQKERSVISVIVKVVRQTLMRSYLDAGNDITAALDIVTALKHGNGLHNSKASAYFSHVKFSNKLVSSKK